MKLVSTSWCVLVVLFTLLLNLPAFCGQGGPRGPIHGWWRVQIDSTNHHYGEFVPVGHLAIGPGRNDGHNHLYCAQINGYLTEYSYNSSTGAWEKATIGDLSYTGDWVVVGNGRNDGKNRIYVSQNDYLYEISYSNGSWSRVLVAVHPQTPREWRDGFIGKGRNDTKYRLYVNDRVNVQELTYSNGWTISQVSSGWKLGAIEKGRNDNVIRLYGFGSDQKLYEVYRSGSQWIKNSIYTYTPSDGNSNPIISGVTVAPGRGDGINRVYASGNDGQIYEGSYVNPAWTFVSINSSPPRTCLSHSRICFGNIRNDGVQRGCTTGAEGADSSYIYDFKFLAPGSDWERGGTSFCASPTGGYLLVGDARENPVGVTRVYVLTIDGKIQELFYQ